MNRFHGDLWNADRATIVTAAHGIMLERGQTVHQCGPLTSGLYLRVKVTDDTSVNLPADVIRRYVWRVTA